MFFFVVAPVILSLEPRELTVVQFEEAVFTCNAMARPRPTITWFRVETDGNLTDVSQLNRAAITLTEIGSREISSELSISVALPSDAGDYICQATNVVDDCEEWSTLIIHGVYIYHTAY